MVRYLRCLTVAAICVLSAQTASLAENAVDIARRKLAEGKPGQALPFARKLQADPATAPWGHHLEGEAMYAMGKFEVARAAFAKALTTARNDRLIASAKNNLALTCALLAARARDGGEPEKALELADESRRHVPDYPYPWYITGTVRAGLTDYEGATSALEAYLAMERTDKVRMARAHQMLGFIAWDTWDLVAARRHFEQALSTDPSDPIYRQNLEGVAQAVASVEKTTQTETRLFAVLVVVLAAYVAGGYAAFRFLAKRGWL